jgi:LysM repeat protein
MRQKPPYTLLTTRRSRVGRGNIGYYILAGLSLVLIAAGFYFTGNWVVSGGPGALFPSETPTPTLTFTPSSTPTITSTPTVTLIPASPTASAPFFYTVVSGDTISSIADQFGVEFILIMILNGLNNDSLLSVGQQLVIPDPNMQMPEPTPLPDSLPRGFEIEYLVLPGDLLASIAAEFYSTEQAIIDANDLLDPNSIFVGQLLLVPVNLITPTPGPSPTPVGTTAPTASPTP